MCHIFNGNYTEHGVTYKDGRLLKAMMPTDVLWSVRKDLVKVSVAGKEVFSWKDGFNKFSLHKEAKIPNTKALGLESYSAQFKITRLILTPKSGKGRKLR